VARTAARLLTDQPLPAGDRLAIVGNAGGLNTLAADSAYAAGPAVPEPSPELERRIALEVPWLSGSLNPLDLGAGASPTTLAQTVRTVASSGDAEAVLATFYRHPQQRHCRLAARLGGRSG
jgi:acyl-CoA synthetase (NDP forming)